MLYSDSLKTVSTPVRAAKKMSYFINSTQAYHINDLNSLGWELTVSNCLYPDRSPCRSILVRKTSYGRQFYEFIKENLPLERVRAILEIGGGYGYLMHDILTINPNFRVTMVDISPFLLAEQKKTLAEFPLHFILSDVNDLPETVIRDHDFVILNENVGDFPTAVDIPTRLLFHESRAQEDPGLSKIRNLFETYAFPVPEGDTFNFNLGAVETTERLCRTRVPFIFISEHSCEARVPDAYRGMISVSASGNPGRISLKGHDEYTIKFSHLEYVANRCGYDVRRGPIADFIRPDFNDSLMWLLKRRHSTKQDHEILRHFIEDLYQYEYLLLMKKDDEWERTTIMQGIED